jgi:hypothetical protein
MRILLFGDLSAMNLFLKDGLEKNGHEVDLVSSGDGFKNIPRDFTLHKIKQKYGKIIDTGIHFIDTLVGLKKFKNYDIVQIAFDHLYSPAILNKIVINSLISQNKFIFLTIAGSNQTIMNHWLKNNDSKLKLLFTNSIKFDGYKINNKAREYELYLSSKVNGIVPVAYEYLIPYINYKNVSNIIPLPINLDYFNYQENIVTNKLLIFHGLNKYGFKGTFYIEKAFEYINSKYASDVNAIIHGKINFNNYIHLLTKANVVIDQTSSHSLGMNGLISLSLGKVVLGGDKIGEESLGYINSPIISMKPDVKYIIQKLEELIENKHKIQEIGLNSRNLIEKFHSSSIVAQKYLQFWDSKIN